LQLFRPCQLSFAGAIIASLQSVPLQLFKSLIPLKAKKQRQDLHNVQTVSTFALRIHSRQAKVLAKQYGKGKSDNQTRKILQ
jgi:hypothetical protein